MCDEQVKNYFDYALPLIKEAGTIIREAKDIVLERKEEIWDLVTEYDRRIEDILIKKLKGKYPNHKFIGEEESSIKGSISELTNDPTWIIDPIDGTANFVRRMPITCISVGLTINKEQVMGIIYNPFMEELYTAIKGQGAYKNGERIYCTKVTDIGESNFSYELSLARSEIYKDLYMYRLNRLISVTQGIRSFGCAALGLCFVACGYTDSYQCDGLKPWDSAAGVVIVREAGGYVCDSSAERLGEEFDLMNPNFLATATKELALQYLAIEKQADQQRLSEMCKKN